MQGNTTEILFDKFEIVEVLKKDEYAAVFLANHIYLSKKIILKVLNTQKISDQALVERFKREAKLLAKLDHPNIIKVLDFGTSKEYFYISFEYIEGDSLRNLLKNKTLSYEEKKHLTVQLFQALHFAHNNNIIHRDIKPENIFIDRNLNLKLGDFGLALSSEDSFVTNPYSIVGTPSYMSPEQVRGAKLTVQSDLFSAGVVVCEIFSSKNPFLKENVSLTLNEIMSYDENAIKTIIETFEPDIKDIVYNLLRRKPENRYKSASDVLHNLGVNKEQFSAFVQKEKKSKSKVLIPAVIFIILMFSLFGIYQTLKVTTDEGNKTNEQSSVIGNEKRNATDDSEIGNTESLITNDELANRKDQLPSEENTPQQINGINVVPVVRYGALFVECTPWAEVFIDGERIETTPMSKPITLTEGDHTVKLVHPDFPIYSDIIRIEQGQVKNLRISLESLMGYISCRVHPWGNIYVNGDFKGQTPLRELIRVVPGFVRLTIKNPNFKDIDTTFKILQSDTLHFRFAFQR